MAPYSTAVTKSATLAAKPVSTSAVAMGPRCPVGSLDPNDDQGTDGTPPKASISVAGSVPSANARIPGIIEKSMESGILVPSSTGGGQPLTSSKSVRNPTQTQQEPSATAMSLGPARTVRPRQLDDDMSGAASSTDLAIPSAPSVPGGASDLAQPADSPSSTKAPSTGDVTDSFTSAEDVSDTSSAASDGVPGGISNGVQPYPAGNSTVSGSTPFGSGVSSTSTADSDGEALGSDSDFQSDADTLASPEAGSDYGSDDTLVNSPDSDFQSDADTLASPEAGSDYGSDDTLVNSPDSGSESPGEVGPLEETGSQLPSTGQGNYIAEDDFDSGDLSKSKASSSDGIESPAVPFPPGQKIRLILSPLSSESSALATSNSTLAASDEDAQDNFADSTEDVNDTSAGSTEDIQDTSADSNGDNSSAASGNSADSLMPRASFQLRQEFNSTTESSVPSIDGSSSVPLSSLNAGPGSVPNESYVDVVVDSEGKLVPDPDSKATHSPPLLHLLQSLGAQDASTASIDGNDDSTTAPPGLEEDFREADGSESMPQGESSGGDDSVTTTLGSESLNEAGADGRAPKGVSKRHTVRDHKDGYSGVDINEKREPSWWNRAKTSTPAATPTHSSAVTASPKSGGLFNSILANFRGKPKSNSATPTSHSSHATSVAHGSAHTTPTHGHAEHGHAEHGHSEHGHSDHDSTPASEDRSGAYTDSNSVQGDQNAPIDQDATSASPDAMSAAQESGRELDPAAEGQDFGSAEGIPQDGTMSGVSPDAAGMEESSQADTLSQPGANESAMEKRTPTGHQGGKHTTKSYHMSTAPSHAIKHATTMITAVRSGHNHYAEATMTSLPGAHNHGKGYSGVAQGELQQESSDTTVSSAGDAGTKKPGSTTQ